MLNGKNLISFLFLCAVFSQMSCGVSNNTADACPTGTTLCEHGNLFEVNGEWTSVASHASFSPRDSAASLVYANKMWLSNGYFHNDVLYRDLWTSDDGVSWNLVNAETPYDGYSDIVAFNGKMWAIKDSVWNSEDGVNWELVSDIFPYYDWGYNTRLVFQDKIWFIGNGVVAYTTDGVNWIETTGEAPFGMRYASAATVFNDHMCVLGGATYEANDPIESGYSDLTTHNDVWCSDDGATWNRLVEHAEWDPRQWFCAIEYHGELWVIAGFDNVNDRNLNDVWHSSDGVVWEEYQSSDVVFSPRHAPTCYVFNDALWVIAGNEWPVQNDVWKLRIVH